MGKRCARGYRDKMCEGKLGGRCTETSAKTLPVPTEFALTTSILPLPLEMSDAPLAQLDRASDYGSEGWGFDSLKARHGNNGAVRFVLRLLMRRMCFFV